MHGYQHVFDIRAKGIISHKKHSEFAGHPYVVQSERIKKGKDIFMRFKRRLYLITLNPMTKKRRTRFLIQF